MIISPIFFKGSGRIMILMSWLLLLALLSYFFHIWGEARINPNQHINSMVDGQGIKTIMLKRNYFNHYVASGWVNSHKATFILDTGATNLVIPGHLAKQWGIKLGQQTMAMTAGGNITVYRTKIHRVKLGNIELHNLRGIVNPKMHGDEVLLGMSVLKYLEFHQRGDTLTITQHPR